MSATNDSAPSQSPVAVYTQAEDDAMIGYGQNPLEECEWDGLDEAFRVAYDCLEDLEGMHGFVSDGGFVVPDGYFSSDEEPESPSKRARFNYEQSLAGRPFGCNVRETMLQGPEAFTPLKIKVDAIPPLIPRKKSNPLMPGSRINPIDLSSPPAWKPALVRANTRATAVDLTQDVSVYALPQVPAPEEDEIPLRELMGEY